MDWARWAGQIEYSVYLHIKRESYVMAHQLEISVLQQLGYVAATTRVEIVYTKNFTTPLNQSFAEMRTDKTGPPVTRTRSSDFTFSPLNRNTTDQRIYKSIDGKLLRYRTG